LLCKEDVECEAEKDHNQDLASVAGEKTCVFMIALQKNAIMKKMAYDTVAVTTTAK